MAVLLPWLLSELCALWTETAVKLLLGGGKITGEVVIGDEPGRIEADGAESCKPL